MLFNDRHIELGIMSLFTEQLRYDGHGDGESDEFLPKEDARDRDHLVFRHRSRHSNLRIILTVFPWVLSVILTAICLLLLVRSQETESFGSYKLGFGSDLSECPLITHGFNRVLT